MSPIRLRSLYALVIASALGSALAVACGEINDEVRGEAPGNDASTNVDSSSPGVDAAAAVDAAVDALASDAPFGDSVAESAVDDAADAGSPTAPSLGCDGGLPFPMGTNGVSLAAGGKTRTMRVHVPSGYQAGKPAPVVLVLHGGGGSGDQVAGSSKMDAIADREGFIAVYPDGIGLIRTFNGGLCCGKAVEDGIDDVGFIATALDYLETALCTDRKRVFATGMSNGAIMSHRLACELSPRIAAIAPIAGTIGVSTCAPTSPVAVMTVHGTNDGHVPWDGGVGCGPAGVAFNSVAATLDGWRQRNGCTPATAPFFQQGNGDCVAYQGCQTPLVACAIDGGGHSWPGGEPKVAAVDCPADGAQSLSFVASEAAWAFFKANPKP